MMLAPVSLVLAAPIGGLATVIAMVGLPRVRNWPFWGPTLLVVAALVLATALSERPLRSAAGASGLVLLGLLLVHWHARCPVRATPLLWSSLAVGTVVLGIVALIQFHAFGIARPLAFTHHPNALGLLALACVTALAGGVTASPHTRYRVAIVLATVLGLVALLYSGSRSAYIGLAVASIVFVILKSIAIRKLMAGLSLLAAITLGLLLATLLLPQSVTARVISLQDPLQIQGDRLHMWEMALTIARDKPVFGHGFGAWRELALVVDPHFNLRDLPHPHSLYLELLIDGGAVLLASVLIWLGVVALALLRAALRGSDVSLGVLVMLIGVLTHNVFDNLLYDTYLAAPIFYLLGIGLAHAADTPAGGRLRSPGS
jgi:O-antigen ligase